MFIRNECRRKRTLHSVPNLVAEAAAASKAGRPRTHSPQICATQPISNPERSLPWCPACLKWSSVFSLAIQSTKLPTSKATVYMASAVRLPGGQGLVYSSLPCRHSPQLPGAWEVRPCESHRNLRGGWSRREHTAARKVEAVAHAFCLRLSTQHGQL